MLDVLPFLCFPSGSQAQKLKPSAKNASKEHALFAEERKARPKASSMSKALVTSAWVMWCMLPGKENTAFCERSATKTVPSPSHTQPRGFFRTLETSTTGPPLFFTPYTCFSESVKNTLFRARHTP